MKRKTEVGLMVIIVIVSVSIFAGCVEKEGVMPSPSTTPIPTLTTAPYDPSAPSTTPTPTPTTPPFEKLSFFEEELVGKWSRCHAYDGSCMYFIFNSDRTGCYFEIHGSSRKKEKHYSYWKLDSVGNNAFLILHDTSTPNKLYGNDIYDFIEDAIFYGGYKKLKMTRSSTSREC